MIDIHIVNHAFSVDHGIFERHLTYESFNTQFVNIRGISLVHFTDGEASLEEVGDYHRNLLSSILQLPINFI